MLRTQVRLEFSKIRELSEWKRRSPGSLRLEGLVPSSVGSYPPLSLFSPSPTNTYVGEVPL